MSLKFWQDSFSRQLRGLRRQFKSSSSRRSIRAASLSESLEQRVLLTEIPIPLRMMDPAGALVYQSDQFELEDAFFDDSGETDSYTIDLDAGQTASVIFTPFDQSIRARVAVQGPGATSLGSVDATDAGEDVLFPVTFLSGSGTYQIDVSNLVGFGEYGLTLLVNGSEELESFGAGSNDTIATAQDIANTSVSLSGAADRLAVRGRVGSGSFTENDTLYLVGPESDEIVTVNSSSGDEVARVEITPESGGAFVDGASALAIDPTTGILWAMLDLEGEDTLVTLDPVTGVATSVGETGIKFSALTFDSTGTLYGVAEGELEELFTLNKTDGTSTLVFELEGHDVGEALAFNPDDGLLYRLSGEGFEEDSEVPGLLSALFSTINITTLNENTTQVYGDNEFGEVQALTYTGDDTFLMTDGFDLYNVDTGGNTYLITGLPEDVSGLAFVPGPVTTISDPSDVYQLSLTAGESASVGVDTSGGPLALELLDSSGTLLATGIYSDAGVGIYEFLAPATDDYFVRVSAPGFVNYQMVVTRGATFDLNDNRDADSAQHLAISSEVLGILEPPDLFAVDGLDGNLYRLGRTDASLDYVGSTDYRRVVDLAFRNDGTLFASADRGYILTVDPTTGVSTELPFKNPSAIHALEFDGVGTLYASMNGVFGTIDVSSGQFTEISDPDLGNIGGLAVDPNSGILYASGAQNGNLYTVDPVTGVFTFQFGADFDSINGLAFDAQGTLFGSSGENDFEPGSLFTLDLLAQESNFIGRSFVNNLAGISFQPPGGADHYSFFAAAGDVLQIQTSTPVDGTATQNNVDPRLQLFDATNTLVAMDDNSHADGKNAIVDYTVPTGMSGIYRLAVSDDSGHGEYTFSVTGATDETLPAMTIESNIVDGTILIQFPSELGLSFSSGVLLTSLSAGDLTVNGQPATSVTVYSGNELGVDIAGLATGDGTYTIQVASNSVTSLQGAGNAQFDLTFTVDSTGPSVTASSIVQGDILFEGDASYTATFNESLQPVHLGSEDVVLQSATTGQTFPVANFAYNDLTQLVSFDMNGLAEDNYTLTLVSGSQAFRDLLANPMNGGPSFPLPSGQGDPTPDDFVVQFSVDAGDRAVATPLTAKEPSGSLVYDPPIDGVFHAVGDVDAFTIDIDAEQRITLVIEPLNDLQPGQLQPGVELFDPNGVSLGSITATSAGERAILQNVPAGSAGTYRVEAFSAAGHGAYQVRVVLNAAAEVEDTGGSTNDTLAGAENIDGAFAPLIAGASRAAVLGTADGLFYTRSHTEPDSIYRFNVVNMSFTEALPPTSDAFLTVTASGLLLGPTRFLTIEAEGIYSEDVFMDDGTLAEVTTQILIDQATLATLVADGQIDFTITVSDDVTGDIGTFVTLDVNYGIPQRPDVYSVKLLAGETVSVAASSQSSSTMFLELADASGALVALGVDGYTNVESGIADFVVPADGLYHLSVRGNDEYTLLVTRDATFSFETNVTQSDTQFIGPTNLVLAGTDAEPIVVEPDAFIDGAVITVPGITLGVSPFFNADVTAEDDPDASTGGRVIARNGNPYWPANTRMLQADFDTPVPGIAIDIVNDPGGTDQGIVQIFDVAGNLLDTITTDEIPGGEFVTVSINRKAADIGRVRAGGLGFDIVKLDNLRVIGDTDDEFSFYAEAGDQFQVQTYTPGDGPLEPVNDYDPRMTLFDPNGQIVGIDDNSSPDGHNARINYTVPSGGSGLFTAKVVGKSHGAYIFRVTGASPAVDFPPTVIGTFPAEAAKITSSASFPIDLTFDQAIRFDTVDVGDLIVDGGVTVNSVELIAGQTVRFIANVPDVEGTYSFQLAADVLSDLQGSGNIAYSGTFEIDRMGPSVLSTLPTAQASAPFNQLILHFDDLINGATFLPDDLTVTGPAGDISSEVTGVTVSGSQATVFFNDQTVPGLYTFEIGPNVEDVAGNPMDQNANGINGEAGDLFAVQINLQSPDLEVQSASVPAAALFGDNIFVDYTIANTGSDPAVEGWVDRIWLSTDNTLDGDDIELKTIGAGSFVPLANGDDYSQSVSVTLPLEASLSDGSFFVLIETDGNQTQPEASDTNNLVAQPILLTLPPIPDLIVSDIVAPVEAISGQQIPITWTVMNQGTGPATGTWADSIFVTDNGTVTKLLLQSFEFVGTIPAGQSITRTQFVTLPINLSGNQTVFIKTDNDNDIFEHAHEFNNSTVDDTAIAVTLAPFANLQVSSITIPTTGSSGQQMGVEWVVTNNGTGPTNNPLWLDEVYLSIDPVLDLDDIKLGRVANPSFLAPGDSYVNSRVVTLPNGLDGDFYLFVKTDVSGRIFESDFEGDNELSALLDVQLTPPPDLHVTTVSAPAQTFSGQWVDVTWTVENQGNSTTDVTRWSDRIYLSTDTTLDDDDLQIAEVRQEATGVICHLLVYGGNINNGESQYNPEALHTPWCALGGGLEPGESYEAFHSVLMPYEISGQFFVLVETDVHDELYEHAFEANNVGFDPVAVNVLLTPPPDLEVTSATVPSTAVSGLPLDIDYQVANFGSTATPVSKWQDRIYLSVDTIFDPETDLLLGERTRSGSLGVGLTYDATFEATIPRALTGVYNAFVVTDADDEVFELDNSNNVFEVTGSISIVEERADLVASVSAPTTAVAGEAILIDWSVVNNGVGITETDRWTDLIVVSTDNVFDENDIIVATFPHIGALDVLESYDIQNQLIALPSDAPIGNLFLLVVVDSEDGVYEPDAESNNVAAQAITINQSHADLQVTGLTVPSNGVAGEPLTVSWTVENLGTSATDSFAWTDRVYLSTDSFLDEDDVEVATRQHNGQLQPNTTYDTSSSITIPLELVGAYFVMVVADGSDDVFEGDAAGEANNATAAAITIGPALVPDLVVTNVDAPLTAVSGQVLPVTWTVRNTGTATTTRWFQDAVYLSLDQIFDTDDVFIGNSNTFDPVAPNGEYTRTESFDLPRGLSGSFYVFVQTDQRNRIAELAGESNNATYDLQSVEIQLLPPADLVVGTITLPVFGISGQLATLEYTVENQGTDTAFGSWRDSIYLSSDATWDIGDALFAKTVHNGNVIGGSSYTEQVTAAIPGVVPGDYFVIIRSDILNAILETSEANNIGASLDQFEIDVEQLFLDTPVQPFPFRNQSLFYRLEVPADETVRITTTGGSTSMFVGFERLPSQADYDFRSELLTNAGEVLIPDTEAGTYYVRIIGGPTPFFGGPPPVAILAEALQFEVFDTDFGVGGNVGNRTIGINGARFDRSVTAELTDGNGFSFPAESYFYVDETRMFATFNLRNVAPGPYDVTISNTDGGTDTVVDGLQVVDGGGGAILPQLQLPSATRRPLFDPAFPFHYFSTWGNSGINDVPAPLLYYSSTAPISLQPDVSGEVVGGLIGGDKPSSFLAGSELIFLGVDDDGPPGVLMPGDFEEVIIHSLSDVRSDDIHVLVDRMGKDRSLPFDWSFIRDALVPEGMSDEDFDPIFNQLIAQVGPTWGDYLDMLARNASLIPQEIGHASDPGFLVELEFRRAQAALSTSISGFAFAKDFDIDVSGRLVVAENQNTGESFVGTSLNDGSFVISAVTPGLYEFSFDGAIVVSQSLAFVNENEQLVGIELTLEPGGQVSGSVSDSVGNPIALANVLAIAEDGQTLAAISDGSGEYLIEGLKPGTYRLRVTALDFARHDVTGVISQTDIINQNFELQPGSSVQGSIALAPGGATDQPLSVRISPTGNGSFENAFFGSSVSSEFAVAGLPAGSYDVELRMEGYLPATINNVTLETGQQVDIGETTLGVGSTIEGNVVAHAGQPLTDLLIGVFDDGVQVGTADVESNGGFAIGGLEAGAYTLRVVNALDSLNSELSVTLGDAESLTGLSLALQPGAVLQGTITDSTGAALSGVAVLLRDPLGASLTATTDAQGQYRFEKRELGLHSISVLPVAATGLRTVNVTAIDGTIFAVADIEIDSTATISGQVRLADGVPATSATVVLLENGQPVANAETNASGRYEFRLLRTGHFDLEVRGGKATFSPIAGIQVLQNSDIAQDIVAGDSSLEVVVTDNTTDPDGAFGVLYHVFGNGERTLVATATVQNGRLSFANLISGLYSVRISSAAMRGSSQNITIGASDSQTLALAMDQLSQVQGRITDGSGNAVADAFVLFVSASNPSNTYSFVTDQEGEYTAVLPDGPFERSVVATGFVADRGTVVVSGDDVTQNVLLTPSVATIAGTLVDGDGNPVPYGSVEILDSTGQLVGNDSVDSSGAYSIDTASGSGLMVNVRVAGYRDQTINGVDIAAGSNTLPVIVGDAVAFRRTVFESSASGALLAPSSFFGFLSEAGELARRQLSPPGLTAADVTPLPSDRAADCRTAHDRVMSTILIRDSYRDATLFGQEALETRLSIAIPLIATEVAREAGKVAGIILSFAGAVEAVAAVSLASAGANLVNSLGTISGALTSVYQQLQSISGQLGSVMSRPTVAGARGVLLSAAEASSNAATAIASLGALISGSPAHSLIASITGLLSGVRPIDLSASLGNLADIQTSVNQVRDSLTRYEWASSNVSIANRWYLTCLQTGEDPGKNMRLPPYPGRNPNSPPGTDPDGDPDDEGDIDRPQSVDPNDILGPEGYGDLSWISATDELRYTIRFENDAELADAPAQVVRVTQQLDDDLDFRTFRVGDFGFGDFFFDVPEGRPVYQDRLDLTEEFGIFVDVFAGVDTVTGEAFWELSSVDPETNELPENPLFGFLPPNDNGVEGQGFFQYSVSSRRNSITGTTIDAEATIVFDINEPIDTPAIFHTLDADDPVSVVDPLPNPLPDATFLVSWTGSDIGAGIRDFTIFVSEDGRPFEIWLENTTLTTAPFAGLEDSQYRFYSVARDNAGNTETAPVLPTVRLSVDKNLGSESVETVVTLTARTSQPVVGDQSVEVIVSGLGITSSDYLLSNTSITILDGQTEGAVTLTIANDLLIEAEETATVSISKPTPGITLGTVLSEDIVIADNDVPQVALVTATSVLTEGSNPVIQLVLTTPTGDALPAGYDVLLNVVDTGNGTATFGASGDYTFSKFVATWPGGTASGTVVTLDSLTINEDDAVEASETIEIEVQPDSSPINYEIVSPSSHTVTIEDNDAATVSFSMSASSANEGQTHGIDVRLNIANGGVLSESIRVDVAALLGGTAALSDDYGYESQTVTFNPGDTNGATRTVSLSLVDDLLLEGDETLHFELTNLVVPTGALVSLGAPTSHDVTVFDQESVQVRFATPSSSVIEGTVAHPVQVTLVGVPGVTLAPGVIVTADIVDAGTGVASSGVDYLTFGTQSISFSEGAAVGNTLSTALNVIGDGIVELSEHVNLIIGAVTGPQATIGVQDEHEATISNDDSATISVASESKDEGTGALPTVYTFNITLSRAVDTDVSMTANSQDGSATATDDYVAVTAQGVNFAATSTVAMQVTVDVNADRKVEPDEAFDLLLSGLFAGGRDVTFVGGGLTESATAHVLNDDALPPVPGTPDLDSLSDTGASNTDDVTADKTPTFVGNVGPDEAGGSIAVFANAESVGSADVGIDGSWRVESVPLIDGNYAITATLTDADGNVSLESNALQIAIDTAAPGLPAVTAFSTDTGTVGDGITSDNTLLISGTAEPNSTVDVFANGILLGVAFADENGNWSFDYTQTILADASHSFTAEATDIAGNTSGVSAQFDVTVDTLAPAPPSRPDLKSTSDSGISDADDVTSHNTPTILGTAEPESVIEIVLDGESLGITATDSSGIWSFTSGAIADGERTFVVTARDAAGNVSSASQMLVVTVDTVAPAAPLITSPTNGSTTSIAAPAILGSAEAGAAIVVFEGASSVATTSADGNGAWSATSTSFAHGPHTIEARAVDQAGNQSETSAQVSFTVQTTGSNDAPLITNASTDATFANKAKPGTVVTLTAAFTDPNANDTHTATINWGDGTTTTGTVNQLKVAGTHQYTTGGIFEVSVTVVDNAGASNSQTTTAVVEGLRIAEGGELQIVGSQYSDVIRVLKFGSKIKVLTWRAWTWPKWYSFDQSDISELLIFGCDGNDRIHIDHRLHQPVTVQAGAGNDRVTTARGDDYIDGGAGHDIISSNDGDDTVLAGDGDNRIYGGDGDDQITTGNGADRIYSGEGDDTVNSGAGNDRVDAGRGDDLIFAGADNDYVNAGNGRDVVFGGSGNDKLHGGNGQDLLFGGSGRDYLNGGRGADILVGGDGRDTLCGGKDNDLLIGGSLDTDWESAFDAVAVDDALMEWATGDLADTMNILGNVLDDNDKDHLFGQQGLDRFVAGVSDRTCQ